ncbi:NAD-dependent protein deacylase [Motiliproteus coralliicola]|uniref:NAD-dependent protein deacylase n=1 Tax=Motiliproteus coralliicola TaxID=2283196 RepID=A0A369WTV8_9GAMM|nr:Sir2 family NAD+-dependent deacetylase [Motiliproteus coralliicola]RDE25112.1 NAD-dependent protein deacylase [Motiliproteus coralliicola]
MARFGSIVVLTGAGVSAESGLKTFRASDGLWEDHRIEDVATPEGFQRDPELVYRFYNMRRRQLMDPSTQPNLAHQALAELEQRFDGEFCLVTQNVDNLHEQAGSRSLIHMHGELTKARCLDSSEVFEHLEDLDGSTRCRCCGELGTLRPDIVWFGEMPMQMDQIYDRLERCDLFISIGTSGTVYPANGFVQVALAAGAHTVELNLEPSRQESAFAEQIYGPAGDVVPAFVRQLLD